jgi:ammonium transporter Rh
MDVHTMMFIGFGFLMTFLKKYGYGSIGYNFIIAGYTLEWAILCKGWIEQGTIKSDGKFKITIEK